MTEPVWRIIPRPDQTVPSLAETTPVLVVHMRADGTVLHADAQAFAGYSAAHIVGRAFWLEVTHPDDQWTLAQVLQRVLEEQRRATVSVRFITAHRQERLARLYVLPAAPNAEADIEAIAFDISEQVEVETVFLQSEALYHAFLEQSPMGILHLDDAGLVTFENHAFRQIVGEGVDDAWIGRCAADIDGLEPRLKPLIERMLEDGTPLRGEAAIYRHASARSPVHLVVHGAPIRRPGNEIVGGVMMIEDVTAQHRHADELRLRDRYVQAEAALRETVLADLNETVFVHEAAAILGRTTRADRVHLLIHLGDEGHCATRAVWVRDDAYESFSLYIDSGTHPALRAAVVQGRSLHLHHHDADDADDLVTLTDAEEAVWIPFFDTGRLGGFVLFERMVCPVDPALACWHPFEQQLMERLVRLFEALWSWIQVGQRYRLTVATIEDCLFTFSFADEGRHYLFITPQIKALTGYGAEEILAGGATWSWAETLVHPEDRVHLRTHDDALRNGGESRLTYRIRHADGSLRWLNEQATLLRDVAGRVTISGILTDVTEQKDAEEILLSAREQAASASRLKSTFVSTMSHELRTPLGAINGFADLLADELAEWEGQTGATLPPQIHEFTEAVRQNAKRLVMLADDLFVLSNMEIGAVRLERTAVPLEPLIERATAAVAARLAEKNVILQLDLDPAAPAVLGDAHRLGQVLDNLLSNAAKFTHAGHVAVRTRAASREVVLDVADTGIGIGPEHLGKLFTPFLQEDNRLNRRYGGTGLGLALVKRLLDGMNGRIEVDSEKGAGSTFRVFLPAAAG